MTHFLKKILSLDISSTENKLSNSSNYEFNLKPLTNSDLVTISSFVKCALSKRRRSFAKVKKMSEISGSTAKPWKQKGSGKARQGSRRSVQFVGGRACHGPSKANYKYTLPKKVTRNATSLSIISKIIDEKLIIINSQIQNHKSSGLSKVLKYNNIVSATIISDTLDLKKAASNIKNVSINSSSTIRPTEIISREFLLVDESIFNSRIQKLIKNQ